MEEQPFEISVNGKITKVPALIVNRQTIVIPGKWLKIAQVHDEDWIPGQVVEQPAEVIRQLKSASPRPDIFTFAQAVSDSEARFPYPLEWEDAAAIPTTSYAAWWDGLPQETRKHVRRAERKSVKVKLATFDDALVRGIKGIYDETPFRQGRRFWHYGKDLEAVRRENSSFLDRSAFLAAYFEEELIGFIKMVYVGKVARIMQILSKNSHYDRRPPHALIAKAVETCSQNGTTHFVYGRYYYGSKGETSITEFKRRNGFVQIKFPRYYVPLTLRGKLAMAMRLHLGAKNLIPGKLRNALLAIRARHYQRQMARQTAGAAGEPAAGAPGPGAD